MKVEQIKKTVRKTYNPVTVVITIESQSEFDALKALAWMTDSVPARVVRKDNPHATSIDATLVRTFLGKLWNALVRGE